MLLKVASSRKVKEKSDGRNCFHTRWVITIIKGVAGCFHGSKIEQLKADREHDFVFMKNHYREQANECPADVIEMKRQALKASFPTTNC